MYPSLAKHRKSITALALLIAIVMVSLSGRLGYLMLFCLEHYSAMAEDLHQRECTVKTARGHIIDINEVVIVDNRTVCTVPVMYNQVEDREQVIQVLCDELDLDEGLVRKRVEKRSSRGVIRTNVDKEPGGQIRSYRLAGVRVDEGYKWYCPCDSPASKILGFTGGDSQGVIGLEIKYEEYLKGMNGKILTMSDVKGVEIEDAAENRIEPIPGSDLHISLDVNIQKYVGRLAYQVLEKKNAKKVFIIVMNPQNGKLMAMVNVPEFNLNNPFILNQGLRSQSLQEMVVTNQGATGAGKQELLNQTWRNACINDTYKSGSTFKIIAAATGLELGVVKLTDQFSCPRFRVVEDRKIRCHKVGGHGAEIFLQGAMNPCNPVFVDVGQRLGVDGYYEYFTQFGLKERTGINLPSKATTIMYKKESMGLAELTTIPFSQSLQITPVRPITTAASIVNGGNRMAPHFDVETANADDTPVRKLDYPSGGKILSEETSATMRYMLEQVVSGGSGRRAKLEGYRIGGKTATSEKPPRNLKKYISSSIGFAPVNDPQVMAFVTIDELEGIYYGGTIVAPVVGDLFKNVLPYLRIEAVQEEAAVHLSNPQLIIPGKRRVLITK